ncbi:hypothetical protein MTO96_020921 [Rhipicephalus appendiculatus]
MSDQATLSGPFGIPPGGDRPLPDAKRDSPFEFRAVRLWLRLRLLLSLLLRLFLPLAGEEELRAEASSRCRESDLDLEQLLGRRPDEGFCGRAGY